MKCTPKTKKTRQQSLAKLKGFPHTKYRSNIVVQIQSKAIVMLCPESSLALLAGIKTWNFTVWCKCKQKSGDCSLQRKINVNLIFEGSAGPEFTESTNSQKS